MPTATEVNQQIERLVEQNTILKTALEHIVQHLEMLSTGDIKPMTWYIATKALKEANVVKLFSNSYQDQVNIENDIYTEAVDKIIK